MKKIIAIVLACALLLTSCGQNSVNNDKHEDTNPQGSMASAIPDNDESFYDTFEDYNISFGGLNDPELLQYVQDDIYAGLTEQLDGENYIIESVDAVYVSKEYLEEVEYNSKANIYFGYSLADLDAQFQGERYVFTLGDDGKTIVTKFETYDDTYDKALRNVAIGTGVILVCVTVSVVTAGTGAPACVSMVFAAAAKTGTTFALSSGVISAVSAGTLTAIQTGDMDAALKAAALEGSEGFKWGAIAGVITGGASESLALYKSATTIPTPRQSELKVLERTKGATEQVSYLNGKEVSLFTEGATRPDVVVKNANGTIQAIEVKNYNLASAQSRRTLYSELERQVTSRVSNLPSGSTQKIVLDVRGRGFSDELIEMVKRNIWLRCDSAYPNIPIEILTY